MIEALTDSACAALVNCLQKLGLKEPDLKTTRQWAQSRSVTLRFSHHASCSFARKEKRKVESPSYVTETKTVFGTSKTTEKVVTKVTDYFWTYTNEYRFMLCKGNDSDDKAQPSPSFLLISHSWSCIQGREVAKWLPPPTTTLILILLLGPTTISTSPGYFNSSTRKLMLFPFPSIAKASRATPLEGIKRLKEPSLTSADSVLGLNLVCSLSFNLAYPQFTTISPAVCSPYKRTMVWI